MTIEDERREPPADEAPTEPPADETPTEPPADEAPTEPPADEAPTEPPADEPHPDSPAEEPPADALPAEAAGEAPARETPLEEAPATEGSEEASAEEPAAAPQRPDPRRERRGRRGRDEEEQPDVVPGADLEPDLVLEEPTRDREDEYGDAAYAERYAEPEAAPVAEEAVPEEPEAAVEAPEPAQTPAPRTPMELAADARYMATGKRKTSVARVILRPGSGSYTVNGRPLEEFFPRPGLQQTARQPLAAAGYESRMDVVARLHGGGVSSQAGALRHGIARALVEADPNLRGELKRRGYLTRDPRVKERKKAGLKKARKRPQFSKR